MIGISASFLSSREIWSVGFYNYLVHAALLYSVMFWKQRRQLGGRKRGALGAG